MSPQDLHRLTILAEIADAGGVAAAARRLGLSKATVSHHAAMLERALGLRLLDRLGRGVALTATGAALASHGRAIAAEARAARDTAREAEEPRGRLRLSMPAGIADALLVPVLGGFARAYPGIALDVVATDTMLDLAEERLDAAFRIGGVADGRFVALPLHEGRDVFVAAPSYLDATEAVTVPADLARHPWIGFAAFGREPVFQVEDEAGARTEVRTACRVTTSSGLALRDWAVAGIGIARMPDFTVADDLAAGRLRRVLPRHHAGRPTLHVAYLPERARPANLRRLLAFVRDAFGRGAPQPAG